MGNRIPKTGNLVTRFGAAVLALFLTGLPATVQSQLSYTTNADNTLTVAGFTGPSANVSIPPVAFGLTITGIGTNAFANQLTLNSISIAGSVTNLGANAFMNSGLTNFRVPSGVFALSNGLFQGCSALTSVAQNGTVRIIEANVFAGCTGLGTLPLLSGVTNLGDFAFAHSGLTNVNLPSGISSLGNGVFQGCSNLTQFAVFGAVTSLGSNAFAECTSLRNLNFSSLTNLGDSAFAYSGLTNFSIPSGVPNLGNGVFQGCSNLVAVTSGAPTRGIGSNAFAGCAKLGTLSILSSVTNIGDNAFAYSGLTNFTIPAGAPNLPNGILQGCTNLINVAQVTPTKSIGSNAFAGCSRLGTLSIVGSLTNIGDHAFAYTALTNVIVPAGVLNLANGVFQGCTNLFAVSQNVPIKGIGSNAFAGCVRLGTFSPLTSVTNLGDYAFADSGLTTVTIPAGVPNLGNGIFQGCTNLVSVTQNAPVKGIGPHAFAGCTKLGAFTLVSAVTNIGDYAFADSGLTNFTLPPGIPILGNGVFQGCIKLASLAQNTTLKSIGANAFAGCLSLGTIPILGGLTNLGDNAFANSGLTNVTLPFVLGTLGNGAFQGCAGLASVLFSFPGIRAPLLKTVGSNAFAYCSSLASFTIPSSVTQLGESAFAFSGLTSLTILPGLGRIPDHAFRGCSSLIGVVLPSGVTDLGAGAFSGCSSLVSLTLPASLTSIGDYAFEDCFVLSGVYFKGDVPNASPNVFTNAGNPTVYYLAGRAGWGATFAGVTTSVWIPYTYVVQNGAFRLTGYFGPGGAVTVPETIEGLPVTEIGLDVFAYLPDLTSLTIPAGITNIEGAALNAPFYQCPSLASIAVDPRNQFYSSLDGVLFDAGQTTLLQYPQARGGNYTIPGSVRSIGELAFDECQNLTGLTIPDTVTNLGVGAFSYCTALPGVSLPASVTSLPDFVFSGCSGLTNISLPATAVRIGVYAFQGCSSLSSIAIPEGVTSLGDYAFNLCYNLTNASLPASVTNLGELVFFDCYSLTGISVDPQNAFYSSVNGVLFDQAQTTLVECPAGRSGTYAIPGGVTRIGPGAFWDCDSLTGITLPNGLASIGQAAFQGCLALASITIPASVSSLGTNAFADCALKNVYFRGDAPLADTTAFANDKAAVIYYFANTAGWGDLFAGRPAVLWNPLIQVGDARFGVHGNEFSFNLTGNSNLTCVIEGSANLSGGGWVPIRTVSLTNGVFQFDEAMPPGGSGRFYRLRLP